MKTVRIEATFDGYPTGQRRTFTAGDTVELADDYADRVVGKGLAREVTPAPAEDQQETKPDAIE
jgi:hypothetical protein